MKLQNRCDANAAGIENIYNGFSKFGNDAMINITHLPKPFGRPWIQLIQKHTHQVHKTLERGAKYWSLFSSGYNAKPKGTYLVGS